MASGTAKIHYFIACVATAMLFGVVSGHFRVGRELHMWPVQPRFWQIHPLDRESLGQRQPSAWLQSSDDENNKEGNSEEQRFTVNRDNNPTTQEGRVFGIVRPSFLARWKVSVRSKKRTFPDTSKVFMRGPYQVSEGIQGARAKKNHVAPQAFMKNGNKMN